MPTLAEDGLELDRQVCFQLYAATNLFTRLYGPLLRELGLTYPQYLVMLVLWEGATVSVGELGDRLHLDSGTLTPLIKRLERAGFVTRTRDLEDQRRVLLALTADGRALRKRAARVPAWLRKNLRMSARDAAALHASLSALVGLLAEASG